MRLRRCTSPAVLLTAAALLLPLGTGVASAGTSTAHTWTVQSGEQSADHSIQGMAYLPADVYVHPGDTVTWVANSEEPHTVTFLADQHQATPPAFNPQDPTMLGQAGGPVYQAGTYFNSGLIGTVKPGDLPYVTNYSLSFPGEGDFTYFCLLHGAMMKGVVHVLPASVPYPFSQKDYDKQGRATAGAIVRDGIELTRETRQSVDKQTVAMGNDDGTAMVMQFIRPTVVVHVGDKVTFYNPGMAAPHTVTFGKEPANYFPPSGDPTNFTGGDLNSGIVGPGGTFPVTFNKAGVFTYICALHDYMGMVGTVVVEG